jgi:hypothetical protein
MKFGSKDFRLMLGIQGSTFQIPNSRFQIPNSSIRFCPNMLADLERLVRGEKVTRGVIWKDCAQ